MQHHSHAQGQKSCITNSTMYTWVNMARACNSGSGKSRWMLHGTKKLSAQPLFNSDSFNSMLTFAI